MPLSDDRFEVWLQALEKRHYAELTFPEVRKGLQAVSAAYVQKRQKIESNEILDGRGKRAAFALFYGPLHFLVARQVVRALAAADPPPDRIVDLGCGTAVAGAAWALEAGGVPTLEGVERNGWALEEARFTLASLGLRGRTSRGDFARTNLPGRGAGCIAGWAVNELPEGDRALLLPKLLDSSQSGARVLVIEPIARSPVPWWDGWSAAVVAAGGRADEWRFPVDLPEILAKLDHAAHLDHRVLTARSLWLPGSG